MTSVTSSPLGRKSGTLSLQNTMPYKVTVLHYNWLYTSELGLD